MLVALIGLTAQAIHDYQAFGSYHDFAEFDRDLLILLRGGSISISRRFNPILFALVPLYALWSDPRILLLLQSIGLAITALPLYWLARPHIGRLLALSVALTYLVSTSVQALNQAVFYEIKLAVPLLTFATFFLLRARYAPFLVCLGLALLLKQEVAFIAVGFAAFIFFVQRKYALGFAIAALGTGLAFFIIQILYPWTNGGRAYPQFDERYAYLGRTLEEVLLTLIRRPDIAIQHMGTPPKITFVLHLLVPLALLPLVGIEVTAISLPAWAYTLLSELGQQFDPTQYYQAPLVPFLFVGTIVGLQRLLNWSRRAGPDAQTHSLRRRWALLVLLFTSSQLYLPSVWTRIFNPSAFTLDQHTLIGYQLMQQIPRGTTIVVQPEFYMPLYTGRKHNVIAFAPNDDYRNLDFLAINPTPIYSISDAEAWKQQRSIDFLFGDSTRAWYAFQQDAWERWRASGYFDTIAEQDGYFLLRRKALLDPARQFDNGRALLGFTPTPNSFLRPLGFRFDDALTLLGYALLPSGKLRGGETLRLIVEWRANKDIRERHIVLVHLVDARGHLWAQDDREPINGAVPTDRWKAGEIVRDQYTFSLPRTMPPGSYRVIVGIWDPKAEKRLNVRDVQGRALGIESVLGTAQIEKDTTSIPASYLQIEQPFYVDMHEIRLLGSTSIPQTLAPGDALQIGLYWRPRAKPRGDYTISVQLRAADGRIALEQMDRPAAGAYPTTLWQVGEVLLDWHDLNVPANLPPGDYALVVVLRNAADKTELGNAQIGQVSIIQNR